MTGSTPQMKSVQRTFEIIDLLWKFDGAGPTEISEEMEIPLSTAHVYLNTLESTGYVINTQGTYQLSYDFLSMGSRIKYRNKLFRVAQPALRELADETGEVVTLVVEQAGQAIILHMERGMKSIDLGMYPGLKLPMHTGAAGKAILSQLPPERVEKIIEMHGLSPATSETITDEDALLEELDEIREDNYAVEQDQQIEGMGTIAVPIMVDNRVRGSLGLACPTERLKDEDYQQSVLQMIRETTEAVTIEYQYGN